MNTRVNLSQETKHWNLIATFGQARLLNRADGRVELHGGSDSDRTEAKQWISLFLHDAVPRIVLDN